MKKMSINQYIYSITKKPAHYVEMRNPPRTVKEKLARPQDARQLQYNRWSKQHQVYSGSYLPFRGEELLKRGWRYENKNKSGESFNTEYIRKSTGQHVLRHGKHIDRRTGKPQPTHYHWKNPNAKRLPKSREKEEYYFDIFGEICARKSPESHIKPHKTRRK